MYYPQSEFSRVRRSLEYEIENLRKRIENLRDALSVIREHMSEYVGPTDIPLQRRLDERLLKREIAECNGELERLKVERKRLSKLSLLEEGIPAGSPGHPVLDMSREETVARPESLPGGLIELCALQVVGDSMIGAGIHDGDIVLVRYQRDVNDGEIAVVRLRDTGEMTLKRFYREEGGRVRLQPDNPTMEPIYIDDLGQVEVVGRVVKVLPRYSG